MNRVTSPNNKARSRRRSNPRRAGRGRPSVSGNGTQPRHKSSLSLNQSDLPGYRFWMQMSVFLLGLGTQGSATVWRIITDLKRMVGCLPGSCSLLMLDGATPPSGISRMHHMDVDLNGCGTDPNEGQRVFRQHYRDIRHAVEQNILDLTNTDPHVPAIKSVREALAFWIFAGNGGTSGGMQHEAVDLCHHVARRLNVRQPFVRLVFLGADMPMRDTERTVCTRQQLVMPQTAADNLARWLSDHHSSELLTIRPPGDKPFSIRACDRVASVHLVDQSNGCHDFAVTDELTEMVAQSTLATIFTEAGTSEEHRIADLERMGNTGRGVA